MRFIEKIKINLPGVSAINTEFELGDLTIFIGRANCGKTRILEDIYTKLKNKEANASAYYSNKDETIEVYKKFYADLGVHVIEPVPQQGFIRAELVRSPRKERDTVLGYGSKLHRLGLSAKSIDSSVLDFGNRELKFSNGRSRPLREQGSGIHNQVQIIDILHEEFHVVLIDEPEISQFPYGKIEILRNITEELENKQILFATHDPTLINQYLIKEISKDKDYKIIVYSFVGDSFKKIDFSSKLDPEIHVGYLSQTYSGKPVHLVLEGQTEFYAFQALITKYCIHNHISRYPKVINKIALSHLGGKQWKINIHNLPDHRYYNTLILLDGEHSEDVKDLTAIKGFNEFKIIRSVKEAPDDKINVITLVSKNFDDVFKKVFGKEFSKPLGLSKKIWSLSENEFNEIDFDKGDLKLVKNIIKWCIEKANG